MEIFLFILSLPLIGLGLITLWCMAYAYHTMMTRIWEGLKARAAELRDA